MVPLVCAIRLGPGIGRKLFTRCAFFVRPGPAKVSKVTSQKPAVSAAGRCSLVTAARPAAARPPKEHVMINASDLTTDSITVASADPADGHRPEE